MGNTVQEKGSIINPENTNYIDVSMKIDRQTE
jgi:hypothetical protein